MLDGQALLRGMYEVFGGEAAFVLGAEVREARADYLALVRSGKDRVRWRDWKKKTMFGHGKGAEGETVYMKLRVPARASDEGTQAFIEVMVRNCEGYDEVYRYREAEMKRTQTRGYAQPGRKRKATEECSGQANEHDFQC